MSVYYLAFKRDKMSRHGGNKHVAKWKKPVWKDYILYHFNYMTFFRKQNYEDSKKISSCQGFWRKGKGWTDGSQYIFRAGKTILWW